MKIKFPDGNVKEFDKGVTIEDIAGSLSSSLKKNSVAGYVNDELYDLNRPINEDSKVRIITKKDKEAFSVLNHSCAHLLAQAVKNLYPKALFGIGPDIEEGFYYDIEIEGTALTVADLPKIEKEMKKISAQTNPMVRKELSRKEALAFFKNDFYKTDLINNLPESETISVYEQGTFTDLCRGGHIGDTKNIKHFKLLSIAGAYWKGDSNNKQLQRIYGTCWFTKDDLERQIKVLEERKERDHRRIGKEQKLFHINSEYGQGLALWLPRGYAVRKVLEDFATKLERKHGYQHISTPALGAKKLYDTSGHTSHYLDNMFPIMERDGEEFLLRPMSCPHHMLVYKTDLRSYRDLPIRYAESVLQHRYEASGALTGLERVRAMTLTDAHIFCTPEQIKDEVKGAFNLIQKAIKVLGIEIDYIELALRDKESDKFHDDDKLWDMSENMLREVLGELNVEYIELTGEAAFYGPKIDIQIRTAMNKVITLSTVQLDFLLPERFGLDYISKGGEKKRPVVIHRGFISTWERLFATLIEQYKGAFPTWLAPEQINIIPVNNEFHLDFVNELYEELFDLDVRVVKDTRDEKLGFKIRESSKLKTPYTLVIGDKEVEENLVTYRKLGSNDQTTVTRKEFINTILKEAKPNI